MICDRRLAAVPAWQRRASLGLTAAVALGAASFTFFISGWIGHWMNVGTAVGTTARPARDTIPNL